MKAVGNPGRIDVFVPRAAGGRPARGAVLVASCPCGQERNASRAVAFSGSSRIAPWARGLRWAPAMGRESRNAERCIVARETGALWPIWLDEDECRVVPQQDGEAPAEFARRFWRSRSPSDGAEIAILVVSRRVDPERTEARVNLARALLASVSTARCPTLFIAAPWDAPESMKHELFGLVEALTAYGASPQINVRLRFGTPPKGPGAPLELRRAAPRARLSSEAVGPPSGAGAEAHRT